MCGRYYLERTTLLPHEAAALLNERFERAVKLEGEVFPGDLAPVRAPNRRREKAAFAMEWGYTLPDGRRVINARSETAGEKPLFRDGMAHRRCVVPASRYFEWQREGKRRARYAVWAKDGGALCMAGVYRVEEGRAEFAILTRAPAEEIAFIHDRMPVLLPADLADAWLDAANDPKALLDQALREVAFAPDPGEAVQLGMEI